VFEAIIADRNVAKLMATQWSINLLQQPHDLIVTYRPVLARAFMREDLQQEPLW